MTTNDVRYLETRAGDLTVDGRTVIGRVVPYDETSYMVPSPGGERVRRGAFDRSIRERGERIFLHREHDGDRVGRAVRWSDDDGGLVGEFLIRESDLGDQTLAELADGWWPYMSVGFRPMPGGVRRGDDGAVEVVEAALAHVALVPVAAYEGARTLAVRSAADRLAGLAPRADLDDLRALIADTARHAR